MDVKTMIIIGSTLVTAIASLAYLLTQNRRQLQYNNPNAKSDEFNIYEDSNCPICLESMNVNSTSSCALLNCGHYLHRKCLEAMTNSAGYSGHLKKCPICRTPIRFN